MKNWLAYGAICLMSGMMNSRALGGGEEVVVVYNSAVPQSKEIADYYALRRGVPKRQVYGFELTRNEEMSRSEFRDTLQWPLAEKLKSDHIWRFGTAEFTRTNGTKLRVENTVVETSIRYAVLCYGVPLKIAPDPNLKEPGDEKRTPEMRRNEAAVDSELCLLPSIEQNLPLAGPLANPLYQTTDEARLSPTNGVLMISRLDGPSPEIARGLVDKAIEAEENGLWGRTYFDLRSIANPDLKMGDDWIRNAADVCRLLGFETIVDTNEETFPASFPMSQIAFYAGWYAENASGPFALPRVEFMPGAFAYHLHSVSASTIRSTNRFWVGPLLAKGVTATMGCVNEPYLGGTPNIGVFAARWIYNGFTFGEAAFSAQIVLSWQTTVVGDPLYRPFGKNPEQLHLKLVARHSDLVDWSYLRKVDLNLVHGASRAELVDYLERLDRTRHSAVLEEKVGDLCAASGKPSSATEAYLHALRLGPTAQQRIRLRLTLGEKLRSLGRDQEAFENYESLLRESPDYAGKLSVYQTLLPLARKLGKKAATAEYEAEIQRLTAPASAAGQ